MDDDVSPSRTSEHCVSIRSVYISIENTFGPRHMSRARHARHKTQNTQGKLFRKWVDVDSLASWNILLTPKKLLVEIHFLPGLGWAGLGWVRVMSALHAAMSRPMDQSTSFSFLSAAAQSPRRLATSPAQVQARPGPILQQVPRFPAWLQLLHSAAPCAPSPSLWLESGNSESLGPALHDAWWAPLHLPWSVVRWPAPRLVVIQPPTKPLPSTC